jgi:hypothetical protein
VPPAVLTSDSGSQEVHSEAQWNSLKTKLEMEIGVTGSWEVPEFREFNDGITGYQAAAPNAKSLGVASRWKLPHVGEQYSFDG